MSIFKRGRVYWYHFIFNGKHIQESSKQGNPRVARQMEAACRVRLAKAAAGIEEPTLAPHFATFAEEFLALVKSERKAQTHRRYSVSLVSLKEFFGHNGSRRSHRKRLTALSRPGSNSGGREARSIATWLVCGACCELR
jgi:hypothetical protein